MQLCAPSSPPTVLKVLALCLPRQAASKRVKRTTESSSRPDPSCCATRRPRPPSGPDSSAASASQPGTQPAPLVPTHRATVPTAAAAAYSPYAPAMTLGGASSLQAEVPSCRSRNGGLSPLGEVWLKTKAQTTEVMKSSADSALR